MDQARVGEIIENIYTAAFEEDGWDSLLQTLRIEFRASQFVGFILDKTNYTLAEAFGTISDTSAKTNYESYYHRVDHGLPLLLQCLKKEIKGVLIFPFDQLVKEGDYFKSELYNDFNRHYDMGFNHWTLTSVTDQMSVSFGIHRPVHNKYFSESELKLLTELTPHLSRGLRIYREMEGLRAKAGLLADALDAHGAETFMLDALGRVLSTNKAAGEILTGGQLTVCEGRLTARHPQDDAALQAALRPPQPGVAPAEIVIRGPGHSPALRLSVTPVNGGGIPLFFDVTGTARTAFLLTAVTLGPTAENLMAAHGLTRAEAEVTLLLLAGARAAQIASLRETSIGTVNTQLKNIYAKMGVTGHVELLVKLLGR